MAELNFADVSLKVAQWEHLDYNAQQDLLARPALAASDKIETVVADVIKTVRQSGDLALKNYAKLFDKTDIESVLVPHSQIEAAASQLSSDFKAAVATAKANVEAFHRAQIPQAVDIETMPGVRCELRHQAIESVGLYVPGGSAPLPSTVLMLAIPALIAGCKRIVLSSPPPIAAEILYTANLCGVQQVYAAGGAQAIAAMAFGTQSVQKVDKIFGPGNAYVTEAKRQVSNRYGGAAIDMPAGPSEVLVIADHFANPHFVAADLLSQAEHGPDSQVVLVSDSDQLIEQTRISLSEQLQKLSRGSIASQAISHSMAIKVADMQQAMAVSNQYGPEHLIIQTQEPRSLLEHVRDAGSVFLGEWTPESVGDYASGTNHTLPTYGYTRTYSSLGTADFMKRFTVQELSEPGLKSLRDAVVHIANAEGLDAHRRALTIRLGEEQ
ncbi:histidinol dehydrogenase [Alginatibacterium sediminis]|uniref:Histidinol dehydrogenase n=1 Tax=Alginatibacterium sediminis TaxID=2164068 RepID=A0A420EFX9_9ALTE|nr:histidinol dehydrogenase [Alginatibacterium sediminis]RKF19570.1 histidinol dehydrogenase [Alginatibacterium sediminis]